LDKENFSWGVFKVSTDGSIYKGHSVIPAFQR